MDGGDTCADDTQVSCGHVSWWHQTNWSSFYVFGTSVPGCHRENDQKIQFSRTQVKLWFDWIELKGFCGGDKIWQATPKNNYNYYY